VIPSAVNVYPSVQARKSVAAELAKLSQVQQKARHRKKLKHADAAVPKVVLIHFTSVPDGTTAIGALVVSQSAEPNRPVLMEHVSMVIAPDALQANTAK